MSGSNRHYRTTGGAASLRTVTYDVVDDAVLAAGRVRVEAAGPVLTVTLDRPEQLNAQTPATWRALAAIGSTLAPEVRVVVLRGAGASFSAGLDRAMFTPEGLPDEPSLLALAALDDGVLDATIDGFQAGVRLLVAGPGRDRRRRPGQRDRRGLPAGPGLRPAGAGRGCPVRDARDLARVWCPT